MGYFAHVAVVLTLSNRFVRVDGLNLKTARAIDKACSYRITGAHFSPAFRAKRWDGKEHLFKFSKTRGYHAPAGLTEDIVRLLKKRRIKYRVKFATKLTGPRRCLKWNPNCVRRDYQDEAQVAVFGKPVPLRCTLKMPIRSGKTWTVARIIQKLGLPAIIVVPSKSLLYQTIEELKLCILGVEIGQVGDGVYDPQFITVATIQTLAGMAPVRKSRKRAGRKAHPNYADLMNRFDMAVFDEAHHITGEGDWYRVFFDIDCRFKIGVSATVFFDSTKEQEHGIIWLRATCGPIRYEVEAKRLIDDGYLLNQNVEMYRVGRPIQRSKQWSQTLKQRCITLNPYRNNMIAEIAEEKADVQGKKTIVIAREHAHIAAIGEALDDLGVEFRTVTGRDSAKARKSKIEDMMDGRYNVLVGNVMGEGIDLPAVECVINAEGGRDQKNTWQRQRNLTVVEGMDKEAVMVDFYDQMAPVFEKHSRERLAVYESEESFNVKVLKWNPTK